MPGTLAFMYLAMPAAFSGMMPAMTCTLMLALATCSMKVSSASTVKMPWVWTYFAPASTFFFSLLICRKMGSYTGVTAAPL